MDFGYHFADRERYGLGQYISSTAMSALLLFGNLRDQAHPYPETGDQVTKELFGVHNPAWEETGKRAADEGVPWVPIRRFFGGLNARPVHKIT